MNPASSYSSHRLISRNSWFLSASGLAMIAALITGCGGGGGGTGTPVAANTAVTLLASSTANDQLTQFSITLESLTLTSQSGKTVTVVAAPVSDEFIHLNGNVEPLISGVSVPQDVYTSATATLGLALPACVGQTAGQLLSDESLEGPGSGGVTVNVPEPITVSGTAMALALSLQVSASASFLGGCNSSLTNAVLIKPVFNLTPVTIAAQPTNGTNGKALGLQGLIGTINASGGMSVNALGAMNAGYPPTWQVSLNSSTVFQGVSGVSQLAAGMAVDMDLAIQEDGSLLATRVAVPDTNGANLSVANELPIRVSSSSPVMHSFEVEQQGDLPELDNEVGLGSAAFQISSQFTNLQSLPFGATFSAANMVDGQNIFVSSHAQSVNGVSPLPTPASTMTLMPQTINGTVSAISSAGGFTTYTVTLASYDLFTNLAMQPGQTTLLTNPGNVVVYADDSTQTLSSGSPTVGGVFRFNGLVFNDGGTLRMDCAQIEDGVAE